MYSRGRGNDMRGEVIENHHRCIFGTMTCKLHVFARHAVPKQSRWGGGGPVASPLPRRGRLGEGDRHPLTLSLSHEGREDTKNGQGADDGGFSSLRGQGKGLKPLVPVGTPSLVMATSHKVPFSER